MKYYFSKNENGDYKRITVSRDFYKLMGDSNKLVVVDDDSIYRVLTFEDNNCEDKKSLLYPELVKYIREKDRNVYFIGDFKYRPEAIIRDVNDYNYMESSDYLPSFEEELYTLKDNEVLSFKASIDKEILKNAIVDTYARLYNDKDIKLERVRLTDFINNKDLLDMYCLPFLEQSNSYLIPPYSYTHPSLFYILSGIYSKDGDRLFSEDGNKINLSEQNIKDLYIENFSEYHDIVDKLINSIEINIDRKYDLDEFSNSLDFIERVGEQEKDYTMKLDQIKRILLKAKNNEEFFKKLDIIKEDKKEKSK